MLRLDGFVGTLGGRWQAYDMPRRDADCAECSGKEHSRRGMGDNSTLPTRSAQG